MMVISPRSVHRRSHGPAIGEGYDVVCGSRYMKGGRQIGGTALEGPMSRTAGLTLHWLAGIPRATHHSFKIVRTSFLQELEFESTGDSRSHEGVVKATCEAALPRCPAPGPTASPSIALPAVEMSPKYLRWYFHAFRAVSGDPPHERAAGELYANRFDERRAWEENECGPSSGGGCRALGAARRYARGPRRGYCEFITTPLRSDASPST